MYILLVRARDSKSSICDDIRILQNLNKRYYYYFTELEGLIFQLKILKIVSVEDILLMLDEKASLFVSYCLVWCYIIYTIMVIHYYWKLQLFIQCFRIRMQIKSLFYSENMLRLGIQILKCKTTTKCFKLLILYQLNINGFMNT